MREPNVVPRRRDAERTRAALIDAAAEVFGRKGFEAASLDEIAAVAGFTRGAFHHHFGSKEELLAALVDRRNEQLLAGYVDATLDRWRPDRPTASARRWGELHRDGHADVALMLEARTLATRNPALRRVLADAERRAIDATAKRLAEHAAATGRQWRYPVVRMAALLHAISRGLLEQGVLSGEDSEPLMETFLKLAATALPDAAPPSSRSRRNGSG